MLLFRCFCSPFLKPPPPHRSTTEGVEVEEQERKDSPCRHQEYDSPHFFALAGLKRAFPAPCTPFSPDGTPPILSDYSEGMVDTVPGAELVFTEAQLSQEDCALVAQKFDIDTVKKFVDIFDPEDCHTPF